MRTTLYLALIASLSSFIACSKQLNEAPDGVLFLEDALQSPKDLRAALNGVYHIVHSDEFAGRNVLLFAELLGGSASLESSGFGDFDNLLVTPGNNRVFELWSSGYQIINQLNHILAAMPAVAAGHPDFSTAAQNQITGQAYFLRAYTYHQMARYYCRPYLPIYADSLGVPVVLSPVSRLDQLQYPERNTLGQVYQQIWTDLDLAGGLLSDVQEVGRATSFAVQAFRARLYLESEEYAGAFDAAGRVIDGPFELHPDPTAVFFESAEQESIWFTRGGSENPSFAGNNWAYSDARIDPDFAQRTYGAVLTDPQQAILDDARYTLVDLRGPAYPLLEKALVSPDTFQCQKYERNNLYLDYPLFRFSECLLIQAEAALQIGQEAIAIGILNQLRERAYMVLDSLGNPVPNGYSLIHIQTGQYDKTALLEMVVQERQIELAFEGHYLFDLQRRRAEIRPGILWDHPRLRLPIPQREMDTNPNLTQNPSY